MLKINYRDQRPYYQQIKDDVRQLIVNHVLNENDKLPSVRELALKLAINPNTINRAYKELEAEGYVYTLSGKGTFIAANKEMRNERDENLFHEFDVIVSELLYRKVTPEELIDRINTTIRRRTEK